MKARGNGKCRAAAPPARGGRAARARPQNDVEEGITDAQAEVTELSAALDGVGASANAPRPPDGLLERRLNKEKAEKERAIQENESLKKKNE